MRDKSPFQPLTSTVGERLAAIEARQGAIDAGVRRIADALDVIMARLTQRIPSPIVGGEDTVITMAEAYRQALIAALAQREAQSTEVSPVMTPSGRVS